MSQAVGTIASSCVRLVKNVMALISNIVELLAECNPAGVPKLLLNLAVDNLRQFKMFMAEMAAVRTRPLTALRPPCELCVHAHAHAHAHSV